MNYIHGQNMKLYLRGKVIACATDCELSVDIDTVELIPTSLWRWPEYAEGQRKWKVSTNGLVAISGGFELSEFFNGLTSTIDLTFTCGDITYSGKCLPKSCKINSNQKGLAKYSLNAQGSGKLDVSGKVFEADTTSSVAIGKLTTCPINYKFALNTRTGLLYIGVLSSSGSSYTYYPEWVECSYPSSDDMNNGNYLILAGGKTYEYSSTDSKWVEKS